MCRDILGYKGICWKVIDELNILPQDMTKDVDWSKEGSRSRAGLTRRALCKGG